MLPIDPVETLRSLIRFDTTNPPGNERPASEFIASILRDAGFTPELVGPDPDRPNLVAKLAADPEKSTMKLPELKEGDITSLENWIDEMDSSLDSKREPKWALKSYTF